MNLHNTRKQERRKTCVTVEYPMTDKYNYNSISLRWDTVEKLKLLSETLQPGTVLSNAKTVTKLITDSFEKKKTETINVTSNNRKK